MLWLVILRQFGGSTAFNFETSEILGSDEEGKSLFELGSPAALNNLHASSRGNAINLLGLSRFHNDITIEEGNKVYKHILVLSL